MKMNMEKAVSLLSSSIVGIRAGTISTGVVDTVKVLCYGQMTPIKHLATTTKASGVIQVDPFDPSLTNTIAKYLVEAGFNAYPYSKTRVAVNVPPPSGDEKKRIIAHLNKLGEEAKISIRNIRKKCRQQLDKDQLKTLDVGIQKTTDSFIAEVDDIIQRKMEGL